ncbi:MAG: hypothetical protein IT559_04390 [Alphaproteobacteria bacterium]|nr:hypothetical protein [Alphaproteobacteria bacterium]
MNDEARAMGDRPKNHSENVKMIEKDGNTLAENFKWDDYKTADELANVFKEIFPIGTSRSFIEKILLQDKKAVTSGIINVQEYKKGTGGILSGTITDKILYEDPQFVLVEILVKYNFPYHSEVKFSIVPPATGWQTIAFYDADEKLLNLKVGTQIVHHYKESNKEGK